MIFIKVQEEVREGIGLRIDQRNRLYSMDEYRRFLSFAGDIN
ncbi:hypothetical protein [Sphingobacterium sp. HMSC13C05]|nr:hypothetical protein [Sphingobacterium sp. HMSC13C05]